MSTETEPLAAWEIELADSLLVDADLNAEVPCHAMDGECTTPASWIWHHCCGTATYCDEHHAHMVKFTDVYHPVGVSFECARCGTAPMPRPTWRPI